MKIEMAYEIRVQVGPEDYFVRPDPGRPKHQAFIGKLGASKKITITKAQAQAIFEVPETILDYLPNGKAKS